jgi:hypothetical protein
VIDGIRYFRDTVPNRLSADIDNTQYILTRDIHGNAVLSALFIRELYRLLNDRFGVGIAPFTPVKINTITCQVDDATDKHPSLEVPANAVIGLSDLPYTLGSIRAFDANGNDVSDSAVAASDIGGTLFGDGQNLQLRAKRHGKGRHTITITVSDANGRQSSKSTEVVVQ